MCCQPLLGDVATISAHTARESKVQSRGNLHEFQFPGQGCGEVERGTSDGLQKELPRGTEAAWLLDSDLFPTIVPNPSLPGGV
jgi:hypothetical protein